MLLLETLQLQSNWLQLLLRSLFCFAASPGESLWELKKITCCIHVVGQVANNLLWFGSHHKISFYTVCRAPKFATTLLMATNKCTAV